nr:hypothetical protein [Haladaptatus sp. R4]
MTDTTVGLTGYGLYVPENTVTGAEIARESGIPEDVVVEKMGVREKHVCPPDGDHATDMCVNAAVKALDCAEIEASELDAVLYHGSEFKDFVVWSAAANVAERIGADGAFASESYALCAGAPIAIRQAKSMLVADHVERILLVSASREEDLVDYGNEDSSFMFNFGSGACAMVLEASPEDPLATVRESAAVTDGSFSEDVVMPAGGSRNLSSEATVRAGLHTLDVPTRTA